MKLARLLILLIVAGCAAQPSNQNATVNDLPTMNDDYFDRGHRAYLDNCARCHGLSNMDVHTWLAAKPFSEFQIKTVVRNGRGSMPAFSQTLLDDFSLNEMIEFLRIVRRIPPDSTSR